MKNLSLILRMQLEGAPEGPGWYIYAIGDDAQRPVIPPTKVSPSAAGAVAETLATVLRGCEIPIQPQQVVGSGTHLIRQAIKQQLDEAEEAASRIKSLRAALASLGDTVEEVPKTGEE
jgi:hypothetical protein